MVEVLNTAQFAKVLTIIWFFDFLFTLISQPSAFLFLFSKQLFIRALNLKTGKMQDYL